MLEQISQTLADETERFFQRSRNVMRFLGGHRVKVGQTPCDVVFERNKMKVLRYKPFAELAEGAERHKTPVFLVPSLINRHYILDLESGKSFVEYLLMQGFDVFMLNWGTPSAEDQHQTFEDCIEMLIASAIRRICKLTGEEKVHLVGHCMGGMLTLPYAVLYPERVASLLNMTTPVDMNKAGVLKGWSTPLDVDVMVDSLGNAPWPLLQTSFQLLKPMSMLQKTAWFYENLWDNERIDRFLALETWVNDNVSIPGEFYRTYIRRIYQDNALYNGTLVIKGQSIDLSVIKHPILNIAAQYDHIAPVPSVVALKELIPHSENVVVKGGHIGAVISRKASKMVWPQITEFFTTHGKKVAA
jgi:polyhydroxyalkanoate synthase